MKIAIITPGGVDRGGTTRVVPCLLWLIDRLVKCGDEVHVFALRQEKKPDEWSLLGARIHNPGGAHALTRCRRALTALGREHRREPFDVIHALWAVPQGLLASVARKLFGIPVLLHLPGGDFVWLPDIDYGGASSAFRRLALRLAVSGADRVAAPSSYMVDCARKVGIRAERMGFGLALDHWPAVTPRRRAEGAPARLVQVADLSPVKDQETLLRAARVLRAREISFTLELIGEDTMQGAIARRATELGLERVIRFAGFLPQPELRNHLCSADLLVVTSRHEAGPVVALEAAASGVPSVGTRVGLLSDWAPKAARVVDIGDGEALGCAIADLLANEDERLRLASAAQSLAIAENADVTTRVIRTAFSDIVASATLHHAGGNGSPRRLRNSW